MSPRKRPGRRHWRGGLRRERLLRRQREFHLDWPFLGPLKRRRGRQLLQCHFPGVKPCKSFARPRCNPGQSTFGSPHERLAHSLVCKERKELGDAGRHPLVGIGQRFFQRGSHEHARRISNRRNRFAPDAGIGVLEGREHPGKKAAVPRSNSRPACGCPYVGVAMAHTAFKESARLAGRTVTPRQHGKHVEPLSPRSRSFEILPG
ncbi:MAG: hypothetical protein BWY66_01300 [bacterium ADurb.Bin374]|nr:MAG: hypothetical protein BWY66_01300 [bacterium ADurb.Bin374]